MFIYFFLLLLSIFLYLNNKYNKQAALLLMLLMCFVAGLRDINIGIDTSNYVDQYLHNPNDESREILFTFTSNVIRYFHASGNMWVFLMTLIIYVPYIIIINKYSKVPMMSVLLFLTSTSWFFLDSMNGIRQWIAGAFILWGFVNKSEGRVLASVLCIVVAIGFHLSSIIVIPFLFLPSIKLNKSFTYCFIGFSAILGFVLSNYDTSGLFDDYAVLMGLYDGYGSDKLNAFSKYGDMELTNNWKNYVFSILPISAICLASYYERPSLKSSKQHNHSILAFNSNNSYLYNIFLIALPVLNICSTALAYGHRVAFPFLTVQLLCLPEAYVHSSRNKKVFIELILLYFVLYFVYYLFRLNGSQMGSTVPYKFCF